MASLPRRTERGFRPQVVAIHLLLWVLGLAVAFPFLWMVLSSLKSEAEALRFPPTLLPATPHWENYGEAWQSAPFARYFLNTTFTAGSVTASVMVTALLAGYAFGTLEFPGRKLLFGLYLSTMMIPFEVILIPNYLLVHRLGWYDTYAALIVPWGANVFSVFLLTQLFRSLPPDYREAAQLDGCGHAQYLWRVAAPLAMPALATAGLFAFLGSWNSLLWPLLVTQNDRMRPIEVGLRYFVESEALRPHLLMAASTLAVLPIVVLFLCAQRTFVEGVAAGVKE
ncbi:MAG: Carbohydrate uptake transporter, family, permease protein [Armatimonadetes bacterium]|jgi:ABC-type glycerol-3-phosphate transport system permease component|nr:Carbohydrate uptake transporter, family, permease protein [Armatimonadota bacterium]